MQRYKSIIPCTPTLKKQKVKTKYIIIERLESLQSAPFLVNISATSFADQRTYQNSTFNMVDKWFHRDNNGTFMDYNHTRSPRNCIDQITFYNKKLLKRTSIYPQSFQDSQDLSLIRIFHSNGCKEREQHLSFIVATCKEQHQLKIYLLPWTFSIRSCLIQDIIIWWLYMASYNNLVEHLVMGYFYLLYLLYI